MDGTIYRCSDGGYYGDADIWKQFEAGNWVPFCWDEESGHEWVETRDDELLALEPISQPKLPVDTTVECVGGGFSVSRETQLYRP